jgi:3-oxoadipate enol-lactonase
MRCGRSGRDTIERTIPGGVAQAEKNAATSFEIEAPAVAGWSFGPKRAGAVTCPVLSILGTATAPLFVESRQLLHEWFPHCVDADIPGATHLLQMEAPAAVAAARAVHRIGRRERRALRSAAWWP